VGPSGPDLLDDRVCGLFRRFVLPLTLQGCRNRRNSGYRVDWEVIRTDPAAEPVVSGRPYVER